MRYTLSLLIGFASFALFGQGRLDTIDVLQYAVFIDVNDTNDIIRVQQMVYVEFKENTDHFYLDLKSLDETGKGMILNKVKGVVENDATDLTWEHRNDSLIIYTKLGLKGKAQIYQFEYSGIPVNGLIIGKNKFGDRTFFGDNWPNRAHHWFACVDHPMDKAEITFRIESPKHYECIATGELIQVSELEDDRIVHHYKSRIDLPTKVMVIGLADFTWEKLMHKSDFPLTVWPYEKDAMNGFRDMAVSKDVVEFFIDKIGPYPFEKLANVQSTTMFGGMENAGNIFYDENAVTGEKGMEALIAHEIAHQWFGNSASESDWKDLWLSEGFATYLTDYYWEQMKGTHAFQQRLINERAKVIQFSKQYNHPVVDTTYTDLMHLLNPNSYQKGAWILHMLRNKVGDALFWSGVRKYYDTYKFSNASTMDFIRLMSDHTQTDLELFAKQWLFTAGHPILSVKADHKKGRNIFEVQQLGNVFEFPIEIKINYNDGSSEMTSFDVSHRKESFTVKSYKIVSSIELDPNVKLLYEKVD